VAPVRQGMSARERQQAYAADVTYVTAKEAGFDFLRDQLAIEKEQLVHRPFHYALVDEADSILIDEARVPPRHRRQHGTARGRPVPGGPGRPQPPGGHRLSDRRPRAERQPDGVRARPTRTPAEMRKPARRPQPGPADGDQPRAARRGAPPPRP